MINFFSFLTANGWKYCGVDDSLHTEVYELTVLSEYETTVQIEVSSDWESIVAAGHHGVLSVHCSKYECEMPYSYDDLNDIKRGLIAGEENLLAIGMPFEPDYEFHGRNIANKIRRNEKLRRNFMLDDFEKADREYREQKRREGTM